MSEHAWLPLFPLDTVLFPGGVLPLKVFEARYIDMVRDCMKRSLSQPAMERLFETVVARFDGGR